MAASRNDADAEFFFPLLTFDLNDVFRNEIVPNMLPYSN